MIRKLSKRLNSKRFNSKRRSSVKRKKSVKRKNMSMQKGGANASPGINYFVALDSNKWGLANTSQLMSIALYGDPVYSKRGVKPEGTNHYVRTILKTGVTQGGAIDIKQIGSMNLEYTNPAFKWRSVLEVNLPSITENLDIMKGTEDPSDYWSFND